MQEHLVSREREREEKKKGDKVPGEGGNKLTKKKDEEKEKIYINNASLSVI